ncbi:MAG TPA: PH domain-containing protein, partial [Sphingorhabdus sp.]|nr:PH domain-containing protein [Sphingorhabdus sp.]
DVVAAETMPLADEGHRLDIKGLFAGFITGLPQLVFPIVAAVFGTRGTGNPFISVVAVVLILFFSLFFRWLGWRRFAYHVGEHDIRIESGILSRTARSIPYERIQDVSIEQKPLARIMGLGEVRFETGGGEGEDAKLSFVSVVEAERLRELVRARKSGVTVALDAVAEEPEVEQQPVFAMDGKRVFVFGLYSFSLVIFAVLGGFAQQLDFLLPFDLWDISEWVGLAEERGVSVEKLNDIDLAARIIFGLGALASLIFIGLFTGVVRTTLREHGFRLDRTSKGFRRRRGLLTLTDAVMPAHRVQAAVIQTGPIRKRQGWHSLKFVSLAQDSKEETNFVAAPFATLGEIWPIAEAAGLYAPDENLVFRKGDGRWWTPYLILAALILCAPVTALSVFAEAQLWQAANLFWLLVPLAFVLWFDRRNYRDALDDAQLFVRHGWWQERLEIAPQVKVQTVEIAQGPIARWQGLASLHFGISGGSLEMVALPLATARAIRDAVMERVAVVDYSHLNRSA